MPGTIPATSQLDRLISMTAINVLAGSRSMRDRLKLFKVCMGSSIGSQRTMDAISTPPPHSISHLRCVTAKRALGQGWRMIGFGSQAFASCVICAHVIRSFWLRRLSVCRQRSVTWCLNGQCAAVGRHCMVVEVAADDPFQPLPLARGSAGACVATFPL